MNKWLIRLTTALAVMLTTTGGIVAGVCFAVSAPPAHAEPSPNGGGN